MRFSAWPLNQVQGDFHLRHDRFVFGEMFWIEGNVIIFHGVKGWR